MQTCFSFGEPHYITFDGKFITYQGVCRNILTSYTGQDSGLTQFVVYAKNEYRKSSQSVSYPSYVETEVNGYNIRFGRNNVVQVKTVSEVCRGSRVTARACVRACVGVFECLATCLFTCP